MADQHTIPGTAPQEKVEQMTFDLPSPQPIKGFPELRWAGKRPFTSTHYFPAQLKERYGDPVDGWMNRIYWGDNLQVMSHLLKEFRGKVNLVYIDPPFDSNANYKKTITVKKKYVNGSTSAFEEKQYGDIWTNDEYLQFMYERLCIARELISKEGVIFVHCDYRKAHHLRCILDEIFGETNLINEIIWQKCNSKNYTANSLSNIHDTILLYGKSSDYGFNEIFAELREEYVESSYRYEDENGRYRLLPLHASGERNGATGAPWNGFFPLPGNHWRFHPSTMDEMNSQGLIVVSDTGVPEYKKYLSDSKWIRIGTIWLDAKQLPSSEQTNYPTQKPTTIIEKVIDIGSKPGDIVFDCFMGSGTTQAVAMKLGRRFIGADINLGAIQTTTKRLNDIRAEKKQERKSLLGDDKPLYLNFEVYNVNNYDVFRNPVQARELLIQALEIDPLDSTDVFDGMKDGYKVKIMPVNRIASRADLNPIISGINYRELDRSIERSPGSPAERIMLVCMGHEPDLAAHLKMEIGMQYRVEVEVVDILREKERGLTFKYDSEAEIAVEGKELVIKQFYPRNLLQKLSILDENVEEWRELVETVAIDWNYNGEVLQPTIYDSPGKNELVQGRYPIPGDHGIIRVKITDLLSESLEMTVEVD